MKVIDQALLKKVIIERPRSSHKGDYGRLLFLLEERIPMGERLLWLL